MSTAEYLNQAPGPLQGLGQAGGGAVQHATSPVFSKQGSVAERANSGARLAGFESQLCSFLAGWLGKSINLSGPPFPRL